MAEDSSSVQLALVIFFSFPSASSFDVVVVRSFSFCFPEVDYSIGVYWSSGSRRRAQNIYFDYIISATVK